MDLLIEFSYRPEGGSSFQVRWGNWSESNSSSFFSLGAEGSVLLCFFPFPSHHPHLSAQLKSFNLKLKHTHCDFQGFVVFILAQVAARSAVGEIWSSLHPVLVLFLTRGGMQHCTMSTKRARKHPLNLCWQTKNHLPNLETCCGWVTKLHIPLLFFNTVTIFQASVDLVLS